MNLHGKDNKIRTAYFLPRAVEHIQIYLEAFHKPAPDPEAYLFYSRVGGKHVKLTEPALDKRIKIYAADAHKECPEVPPDTHAHQFRRTKATHWLEDRMNIIQSSFLFGHASLDSMECCESSMHGLERGKIWRDTHERLNLPEYEIVFL